MDDKLRRGFRIGDFDVEPLSGRLRGPGGEQRVQPKVMDVLVYLAAHPEQLVERDRLLTDVWRRVTSEEVLTRCISDLRRVFGDERGSPKYIQTVPKRGYRLVAPVVVPEEGHRPEPAESTEPADGQRAARPIVLPSRGSAIASIAVLPFESHSSDPARSFMGDAFAAELHGALARVDRLRVASRRSSFAFKDTAVDLREIGRRLDVDYVITGSVRCDGSSLRVLAELNDAPSGTQLWAESYDSKSEDLLTVEQDIAQSIVGSFTTQRLRSETDHARHVPTSSLDAWGLVQKARAFALDYTPAGFEQAIEPLRRAIELDPDYPAAHAMLGSLLVERLVNGSSVNVQQDEAAALESAERALTLGLEDPFVLKMVAWVWTYFGDYRKAESCLRSAVAYAPFDYGAWGYLGWPLTASGDAADLEELRRILDRLLGAEPRHPGAAFWHYHLSVVDLCEARYETSRVSAEACLELRPSLALGWMHYAAVLGQSNLDALADQALERCRQVNPAMTPAHFESLAKRMTDNAAVVARRLGGLRRIGALQGE